ncbi:CheY-P-specific phosphatase CheC [Baekduia soli]|uniref:CheY-P-specific phosphatase CheC n=1 Tax=Baekduia soli TaxID=496014 RepID=A0A5B8U1H4_9ACTN|nr:chemotaxis protein CheC [Baekduia soli]QEC46851.1 CheY-P-specific phosphatase CheC [Baekduia soli]
MNTYTDLQLDALRELANIGSGNAGTALSQMLGRSVDISVPTAAVLPLPEAVAIAGEPDDLRYGVVVRVLGGFDAIVLLLFPEADAQTLCGIYGLELDTPDGFSLLGEVGNILGTSYINVLARMTSMALEPTPPQPVRDMLGAILQTVLVSRGDIEGALVLDSALMVEGEECSLSFLMLPAHGGIRQLLERLGL